MKHIENNYKHFNKSATTDNLLTFIEEIMPLFQIEKYVFIKRPNEKQLNNALFDYLTKTAKRFDCEFYFNPNQPNDINNANVDFGIINTEIENNNPFFTIECKRLPAPKKNKNDISRENEYVIGGKGGGIERFKLNKHGIDREGRPLKINAMIGYIEENNFEFWHSAINNWITHQKTNSINWSSDSTLDKQYFKKIAKLFSKHNRIDNSIVEFHHFWIIINYSNNC
jgi:hypothetical protein